ncbi:pyridoxamine 5'-phosphate oxidase family protein [Nocardia stercoris]|uniref:Pyridoxamine 5'-phosphate oxidase family protein n=1 Tax=Nocardia stercoris TaxID=2483361 RepID=A0A3M2KU52_9NOCA|nr:pyridoxamine 5'-phosphate oxidase family protein [Nocardia stercoris]RMI28651.1 pyridoxamine 5'-phosphate oxidase family protein [Nocardia stercoris]
MSETSDTTITDPAELRNLLGEVGHRATLKERTALHAHDRAWIAASPYIVLATSAADGTCDASPKGDPPGFVRVLDDSTIVIPERPGNRRGDGYRNILTNPHVGVLFLVPTRNETLRVNGRARLVRDAPYFDDLIVKGNRPILACEVAIEEVFFHCGKSALRSGLWHPGDWPEVTLPTHARISKDVAPTLPESLPELEEYYSVTNYTRGLY